MLRSLKVAAQVLFVLPAILAASAAQSQPQILTNHLGYELKAAKKAVIKTDPKQAISSCELIDTKSNTSIYSAAAKSVGAVDQWRDWFFWTWDFTQVERPSLYKIACQTPEGSVQSYPFAIAQELLEHQTLSDVIYYFKGQRASGLLNKADSKIKFSDHPKKPAIDARGGWYDATGDYSKTLSHLSFATYFNPQQTPLVVLNLFYVNKILTDRNNQDFTQSRRRLLDEALYGADYLVRMHVANGSFYRNVSALGAEKAAEDRIITPSMKNFAIKENRNSNWGDNDLEPEITDTHSYEVSFRAGGGIAIAALAVAARQAESGEFSKKEYLAAAKSAFAFLQKNNANMTNNGKENILDDYTSLMAATELYNTTQEAQYKTFAAQRADSLVDRLASDDHYKNYWRADDNDRPFFHASDAGYPVVSLMTYYPLAAKTQQQRILKAVRKNLEHELAITKETNNPFGYARQYVQTADGKRRSSFFYPHNTETAPWWQGENARLSSLAAAARLAAPAFSKDAKFQKSLREYAWDQLNWILGLNPFDASMLEGSGRNNVQYRYFGSYEYTNAPGGIVNGITSGLDNERDIDLNRSYQETGRDEDWRWAEQWLPHAAWYIYAISLDK